MVDRVDSVDKFRLNSPSGTHIFSEVKIRDIMGGGGSVPPTLEVNQCEVMDSQLRDEFGNDYRTNRETFPITSLGLSTIASSPCEEYFGYEDLVTEYCADIKNFTEQIGNGQTCADRLGTAERKKWCLMDDEGTRLKTDGKCVKNLLRDQYDATASSFCTQNPTDEWCACYNLKNKVCDTNPRAAGCDYFKVLEDNRQVFGPQPVISEDSDDPSKTVYGYSDGFNVLKNNAHCTLRACKKGYIPSGVKSDCKPSYNFCEKDINIQSQSIASIAVDCNADMAELVLPDWWNEERDDSFWDDAREPPFDKFPLNKLPITAFPKKFNWKNMNVRYLTYYTSSSSSLCCLCLLLIMSSLKRR